ncbi:MAG: hypothetical protein H6R45_274, partial [Proteobacteria bacterium]|nr:hypothetical protein [Pseudomonadota bacterium]
MGFRFALVALAALALASCTSVGLPPRGQ